MNNRSYNTIKFVLLAAINMLIFNIYLDIDISFRVILALMILFTGILWFLLELLP